MITREQALECLRRGIGSSSAEFREGQWEAIDGVLHNRRQLAVRPVDWMNGLVGEKPRLVDGGEGCAKTRNRRTGVGTRNRRTGVGTRNKRSRPKTGDRRTVARARNLETEGRDSRR